MSKQANVRDVYNFIDQIAPFETAEAWDNVGLLIGSFNATANKVLLALDITEEVISEAIEGQFDLIVSHHPIIFTGIKSITSTDRIGSLLQTLIQHKISVIAAHTNIDRSFEFGINRTIAELYNLQSIRPLNAMHRFGIVGELPIEMPFEVFIERTKSVFKIETVKISNRLGDGKPKGAYLMRTVALSSGASSDFIQDAISVNADVYITADLKYHEAQNVIGTSLILVDVGHFESESIFLKQFKTMMDAFALDKDFQLGVHVTESEKPVFEYL